MNTFSNQYNEFQRGFGTSLSPTWRELAHADSRTVPDTLTQESSPNLGMARIPPDRYTSHDFHRQEVEKVWKRTWQVVCREEEIPNPGDHFVYEVAGLSFLIVRQEDNTFKGFWNVCLHRGRKLCDQHGEGKKQFKCGYHSWTWNADGTLAFYPSPWDFPDVEKKDYGLRPVQTGTWNGFIFINPDMKAGSLESHLGALPKHFENWPLDKRFTLWHMHKRVKSNWKIAMEAFLEGYHLVQTHPQALPSVAEHGAQYDVWEDGEAAFSRSITPTGVPSNHYRKPDSKEALLQTWALIAGLRAEDAQEMPAEIKDRASLAEWRRQALKKMTNADYSSLSDAEMLDSVQYWLFPNFFPWYGEGLPLVYQFRPNTDSPDECFMDTWMLIRVPDDGPHPAAAKIVTMEPEDKYASRPEMGGMALIFDQDDDNLPFIQAGMKSWPGDPDGMTLARYQENRIRFFHQVLMRTLAQP